MWVHRQNGATDLLVPVSDEAAELFSSWRGSQKISTKLQFSNLYYCSQLFFLHTMAPSQQAAWRQAPDAERLERRNVSFDMLDLTVLTLGVESTMLS